MITLDTAKRLKELGFNQHKPLFAYVAYGSEFDGDEAPSFTNGFEPNEFVWVKCLTLEELLEVMPSFVHGYDSQFELSKSDIPNHKYLAQYYDSDLKSYDNNPSEAVAELLIKLVKEGQVKL